MLRTALFTAALLAATLGSNAHAGGDYYYEEPVYSVGPEVSLSVGSLRHDGFRLDVNSGGPRYLPRPVVILPPPVRVIEVVHHRHYRGGHWRDDDRRGWRNHDRRGWRDHDRDRWDDRGRGRGRGHGHGRHSD